ncbi:hypothetical protein DR64_8068 [Paraburkholderia xenovorans LB400]|uniref:hypothetical protein n=1 Tax=Paraburkholderia xenovorans TaxID=36873 RepID=UPI000037EDDC|nr:hypothetical protein [Paraburkholderia xenovorans]AIP34280.1 hypothetical protein DR64_8068 [Paraburkholderia xenovorans LB400]
MSDLSGVAAMLAHTPYLSAALLSTFVLLGLEAWWVRSLYRERGDSNVPGADPGPPDET